MMLVRISVGGLFCSLRAPLSFGLKQRPNSKRESARYSSFLQMYAVNTHENKHWAAFVQGGHTTKTELDNSHLESIFRVSPFQRLFIDAPARVSKTSVTQSCPPQVTTESFVQSHHRHLTPRTGTPAPLNDRTESTKDEDRLHLGYPQLYRQIAKGPCAHPRRRCHESGQLL